MNSFDAIPDGAAVGPDPHDQAGKHDNRRAAAGFGSPGSDSTVKRIDLNDALIRHPNATFVMRAAGTAMREVGIADGDVLLVDRAIQPTHGSIVIAVVDGELACRRLFKLGGQTRLETVPPGQAGLFAGDVAPLEVWGVVTTVIKSLLG